MFYNSSLQRKEWEAERKLHIFSYSSNNFLKKFERNSAATHATGTSANSNVYIYYRLHHNIIGITKISVQLKDFKKRLEKMLKFDEIEKQFPSNLNASMIGPCHNNLSTEVKKVNLNLRK